MSVVYLLVRCAPKPFSCSRQKLRLALSKDFQLHGQIDSGSCSSVTYPPKEFLQQILLAHRSRLELCFFYLVAFADFFFPGWLHVILRNLIKFEGKVNTTTAFEDCQLYGQIDTGSCSAVTYTPKELL